MWIQRAIQAQADTLRQYCEIYWLQNTIQHLDQPTHTHIIVYPHCPNGHITPNTVHSSICSFNLLSTCPKQYFILSPEPNVISAALFTLAFRYPYHYVRIFDSFARVSACVCYLFSQAPFDTIFYVCVTY